jgi:hypothetical protein
LGPALASLPDNPAFDHSPLSQSFEMTSEQLDQLVDTVRESLLHRIDSEIDRAMNTLHISQPISDQEFDEVINLVLGYSS